MMKSFFKMIMRLTMEQKLIASLEERHIRSMPWRANSPELNPIENLWWQLKKPVPDKPPTYKAVLAK